MPLPEPENPPQCAGGFDIDETTKYGTNCLVCKKRKSGDYYITAWETDNVNYDINNNCKKKQDCEQRLCSVIGISDGYTIESSEKKSGKNYDSRSYTECGSTKTCYKEITAGTPCTPKTCAQIYSQFSDGPDFLVDEKDKKPGIEYESQGPMDTGCYPKTVYCYREIGPCIKTSCGCKPKTCEELTSGSYPIDGGFNKAGWGY